MIGVTNPFINIAIFQSVLEGQCAELSWSAKFFPEIGCHGKVP